MARQLEEQQVQFRPNTSPKSGTAFTKASGNPGEKVAYLVGLEKTQLDCGPRGLGFNVPDLNDEPNACSIL